MKKESKQLIIVNILLALVMILGCIPTFHKSESTRDISKENYKIKSIQIVKHYRYRFSNIFKELKCVRMEFQDDKLVTEEYKFPLIKTGIKEDRLPTNSKYIIEKRYKKFIEEEIKKLRPLNLQNKYKTKLPKRRYGVGTVKIKSKIEGGTKKEEKYITVDRFPECIHEYSMEESKKFLSECPEDVCRIYQLNMLLEGAESVMYIKTGTPGPWINRMDWESYKSEYEVHEVVSQCQDFNVISKKLKEIAENNPVKKIRESAKQSLDIIK